MGEQEQVLITSTRVFGPWEHVPLVVEVVDGDHARRAEVHTHQHWSIVPEGAMHAVPWTVMLVLPPEIAPYPLLFSEEAVAEQWVRDNDAVPARSIDELTGMTGSQGREAEHHSLTLFSHYGGGGEHFDVGRGEAGHIQSWLGKQPVKAAIPDWLPHSFKTSGRSELRGHDDDLVSKRTCYVGPNQLDMPFAVLESAWTD